jgi:predicted Zn-dependent peptidase
VQTNRTADSIAALRQQLQGFLGPNGTTAEELTRTVSGAVRELPGSYETSAAVLGAMVQNALFDRPDDYQSTLPSRYNSLGAADLDRAARAALSDRFVWVVVGDAGEVRPQLDKLGLPVEQLTLQ